MELEPEIWDHVPEFEGHYLVSSHGRVKSVSREIIRKDGRRRVLPERILKNHVFHGKKYLYVILSMRGVSLKKRVHVLVAAMFVANPDNKPEVDHDDTDPTNNYYKNLKYVTRVENMNNPLTLVKMKEVYARRRKVFESQPIYIS